MNRATPNKTAKGVAAAFYAQLLARKGHPRAAAPFSIFEDPASAETPSFAQVYNYVYRIFKQTRTEPECLLVSVCYINRFQLISGCLLTPQTFARLVFVGIMVASKVWDDRSCSSHSFAQCSDAFTLRELNQMELVFCRALDYRLFLMPSDYSVFYYGLRRLGLSLKTDSNLRVLGWADADAGSQSVTTSWNQ